MKIFALICLVAVAFADPLPHFKKHGGGNIDATIKGGVDKVGDAKSSLGATVGGLVDGITTGAGKTVGGALDLVGGILGGVLGGGKVKGGGKGGAEVDLSVGLGLQGLLNALSKGLTKIAGGAGSILEDVGQLKLSGAVDDVGNVLGYVGVALGNILNAIIPEGGDLVSNLFQGLTKLVICVLGSPGVVGTLTNDRRPGQNNPPGICGKDFGVKHGCKRYNGGFDSPQELINFYGLDEIDAQLRIILDDATDGQGLGGLDGSAKWIAQWVLELSSLAKKRSSGNASWTQDDVLEIFRLLAQILGGVGESYQEGLGVKISIQIVLYLKENTKNTKEFKNFNWDKYLKQIVKNVKKTSNASLNGAIKGSNNNSQQNTQQSSNQQSSNQQSSNQQSSNQQNSNQQSSNQQSSSNQGNSNHQNSGQQSGKGSSNQEESQFEESSQFENSDDRSQSAQSQKEEFEDFEENQFAESGKSGASEFSNAQEEDFLNQSQTITKDGSSTASQAGSKKSSESGSSNFQEFASSGTSTSGSKGSKQSASEDLKSSIKSSGSSNSSGSLKKKTVGVAKNVLVY